MNFTLCTICARGGSQGIKNKNLKIINGKPLIYFTINQAIKSKIFDHIIVSTDSKKILKSAKAYGADSWFIRPKKLSSNSSPKIPAIRHALIKAEKFYNKKFEFIIDLDVTSPLRKVEDITKAYKVFIKKKGDVLITATRSKKNPYFNMIEMVKKKIRKVKNTNKIYFRRQDAPKTYDMNASIYIWNRKTLMNSNSLVHSLKKGDKKKILMHEMPETRSIDIDSEFDFKLVKFLLKKNS
jgi:CMP-N,N'-diacetyllegionaminic acid synthase|tara:strand:+ start:125 stop:841 length:717 start_codon:yes stop_codon:yes gene_type:complete